MKKYAFNSQARKSDPVFENVMQQNHKGEITGMDTCVRKSLIATCSTDKTIKVWNYVDMTVEAEKKFREEAFALSFHPNGYILLVAFETKICLINIFWNDLSVFKEL